MPAAMGPLISGPPSRFIDINSKRLVHVPIKRNGNESLELERLNNGTSIPVPVQVDGESEIDVLTCGIFWSPNGRSQLPENTAMESPLAADVVFQFKLRESFQTGEGQLKIGSDHVVKR